MEILQLILSLFVDGDKNPLGELLKNFSSSMPDLKNLFSFLSSNDIKPLLNAFIAGNSKKSPTNSVGQCSGLSPIACVADKDIVYALNRYLSNDNYS